MLQINVTSQAESATTGMSITTRDQAKLKKMAKHFTSFQTFQFSTTLVNIHYFLRVQTLGQMFV